MAGQILLRLDSFDVDNPESDFSERLSDKLVIWENIPSTVDKVKRFLYQLTDEMNADFDCVRLDHNGTKIHMDFKIWSDELDDMTMMRLVWVLDIDASIEQFVKELRND